MSETSKLQKIAIEAHHEMDGSNACVGAECPRVKQLIQFAYDAWDLIAEESVSHLNHPHTCHGNEHMPPGPCVACEEERRDTRSANVSAATRSGSVVAEGVTAGETAHYFTPDPTGRFCVICGDNDLGSVWGVHRFQIQPGDPEFQGNVPEPPK
jgi:hypothetical protein